MIGPSRCDSHGPATIRATVERAVRERSARHGMLAIIPQSVIRGRIGLMDISAVLTVAAQAAGASGMVTVSARAARWMRARARFRDQANAARELLGLRQSKLIAYRHDSKHILYSGTEHPHPDNLHGLAAASGNAYVDAKRNGCLRVEDEILTHSSHDLALIGSPTAEGLSRLLFGYAPDGDPDSLALDQVPLDLPFRWVISKNQVADSAVARRFVAGRGLVERPNWRISGPKRIYVPRVDEHGLLLDDYLLVTKVRNYLSPGAIDEGHFILSFGGSHGTGTRALELLFKDQGILTSIAGRLERRPAAFQMLFRVSDIKHDHIAGSHARKIELVDDPIILPDRDSIWRTATEIAQRGM